MLLTEILIADADKIGWISIDVARDEDGSIGYAQRQSHVS